MQRECEQCGASSPQTARYCGRCGRAWADEPIRTVTRPTPVMLQWRLLRLRLTRKEVRKLLGEPARIELVERAGIAAAVPGTPTVERWCYEYERVDGAAQRESGMVEFALADGTVLTWREPDWEKLRNE